MPHSPNNPPPDSVSEIQEIINRIDELSRAGLPREEFVGEFLELLLTALVARAGGMWLLNEQGELVCAGEMGLGEVGITIDPAKEQKNLQLIATIFEQGTGEAIGAEHVLADDRPDDFLFILAPMQHEGHTVGVIEVVQRTNAPPEALAGYVDFVQQMAHMATAAIAGKEEAVSPLIGLPFWEKFEQFSLQVHKSLESKKVAAIATNDIRKILECERVSLATLNHKKCRFSSVSGQESVNQRSNLIKKLTALTQQVLLAGEPLLYDSIERDYSPQIEELLSDYIREAGTRMLMIVPLIPKPKDKPKPEENQKKKNVRPVLPIGGMVFEQISNNQTHAGFQNGVELLTDQVTSALDNAIQHEKIFLLPVWRTIGKGFAALKGRTLAKTIAAAVCLLVVTLVLIFVKYDYRVTAEGRLFPEMQRKVFAHRDAKVMAIYVESGQHVKAGQPLLKLYDEKLHTDLMQAQSKLNSLKSRRQALIEELRKAERQPGKEEDIRLQGRLQETISEIEGLQADVAVYLQREKELVINAPITGVVTTFQLDQLLQNHPVERGEILMEIMDEKSDWHLELNIDDERMGHLARELQRTSQPLAVEFILATDPEKTVTGILKQPNLATRADTSEDNKNIVPAFVKFNSSDIPNRRIAADVRAKINCGKKRLGYVLFGDVIDFLRMHVWF